MRKKICLGIFSLLYGLSCLLAGWLAGIDSGFDTGYRVAYLEMDTLLKEGIRNKVSFFIEGLNIKFFPRKDGHILISSEEDKRPAL
ncbi:MAG: hypothetical protein K8I29_09900 [Alphaproteobacteria bacterium]|uniref:Uncharacterized protein n=1 Tax=Candidatus Nitrobium versatile TaxID=2884831 RepID=A0A953JDC4_9BACT|nr:hypothetical protein [Candidatus Nitrobium versatile]